MCYTKEIQLTTGATIWSFCLFYYIFYSIKYQSFHKNWLQPFLKDIIIVFSLIGGHQIFEFLSLVTKNQIIYKVGLILSILSMYFLIRSLETLLNRSLKSKLALLIISPVAIHIFSVEMLFESGSFYVKHNSAFSWASAWLLLFIYFHVCALKGRRLLDRNSSRNAIIVYLLTTIDISFIISVIYTLWGYSQFSINVCTDSPSIWCTFYVIQVFALPIFLSSIPKAIKIPKNKTFQTTKETLLYFLVSISILTALISTLPFFNCLTLKFVFP